MKRLVFFRVVFCISAFFVTGSLFAQEVTDAETAAPQTIETESTQAETTDAYEYNESEFLNREVIIPDAKRPKKPDADQVLQVQTKNEEHNTNEYITQCQETFKYGLEEEITSLIDELTSSEDLRFVDEIYDLFQETKTPVLKQKILAYFEKLKDPCLEDYAVTVVDDPYDENKDTVKACFRYIAAVDCKAALPCLVTLIEKEDEDYFDGALTCIGQTGSRDEAMFLAEYLDRDDLTVSQRQSLMKVLGKIKAVETWEKLSEIAQNEDENSFVRMYATEAIGAMEKPESEEIILKLFEDTDPNLRVYVIKGISYFHDEEADKLIVQALRDSQYKVRLEAVKLIADRNLVETVPNLIYRCKDKNEQSNVKDECYKVLAKLNTPEANEYLVSQITDKKVGDNTKTKIAKCLLEENNAGTQEIIKLCEEVMNLDSRKNLRYALGKEFAKYGRPEYEDICLKFIEHSDVATQGTGLDIFAKGKYSSVRPKVEALAKEQDDYEAQVQEEKEAKEKAEEEAALKKKQREEAKANGTLAEFDAREKAEKAEKAKEEKNKKPVVKKKPNANAKKAKRILSQLDSYS